MKKAKDPQISEKVLVEALGFVSSPLSAGNLQTAAQLSVLDAFDRGIHREDFVGIMREAMLLHTYSSRLSLAAYLLDICDKTGKSLDKDDFANAVMQATIICEDHREALVKKIDLLVQCPRSFDTQH